MSTVGERPVVIVTGCGSGIGWELARVLRQSHEFRVAVTARKHHREQLEKQFHPDADFRLYDLDVTDESDIYRVVHEVCRTWGRVDSLINNAAVCYRGVVEHMDSESERKQLETNYLGPMTLVRAVLPIMREQRSGQIINVSSASGFLAVPTMGSYSASKHALEGATESLWYESRPFGIKVNLLELGFVNSHSFQKVVLSKKAEISSAVAGPHAEFYATITPFIEKFMSLSPATPEKVARKIVRVLKSPPSRLRVSLTPDAVLFAIVRKMVPSALFNRMAYWTLPGSKTWGRSWRLKTVGRYVS